METVVPGLIKIGKTGTDNFEQRMYQLEHNGYRNVTGLKRVFAIEVQSYNEKETLLHTIFEKSQVSDTELFAIDVNIAIQLLSSFDGKIVYPLDQTKNSVFDEAVENSSSLLLPNGKYTFKQYKKSDKKNVEATAIVTNGRWTLKKGCVFGITEDKGVSKKAILMRDQMQISSDGVLLADAELGDCSPSFASCVVLNQSNNGWTSWLDKDGNPIEKYRDHHSSATLNKE